ncbi:MAG: glutamine-hydrolyzing GMP synthase [Candidatus Marinimicrobia bacterium]|jgi:GMP synthase (glutamine-hydrolysing)|nr:glutamine-hydrolyzing GMP synthase [Candidatus Neomarinimicrobiota bacterium]MBT3502405.1 glutamine-hydrolyzing GMP synthase [Candidatus Neomarinimicrobiota bacterium]MBT3839336.1 glutamine-hydrolyzing GMP synthase [Candidatus Neomarinimicrobiota bacterium]MBT3998674.1 glutamine-hydrolyzing GMP synthase [Candidatus Neomarinimicrobiota bacterium]MBT4283242.1 glutamine-hydrolyzing GMP synthase [Candidatus Neomarinimicrobiota bacterium]
MNKIHSNGIVILDFGSQYTQLIARRVREQNVFSEILPPETSLETIISRNPAGLILSGGPSSIFGDEAPEFDESILNAEIPILGICYGLQLLAHHHGGSVESTGQGEYGFATISVDDDTKLFSKIPKESQVWMSHMDRVSRIPDGWNVLAHSSNGIVAAMANHDQTRVATQFHPEVAHTKEGQSILRNFLFNIATCAPTWTAGNFIDEQVDLIRKQVGDGKVLCGVSGGVDSTVVAALLHKAIGSQSTAVLIDHGLLRKNEARDCVRALKSGLGVNINMFDESDIFLSKLKGVTDPEKKRKIIGNQFIYSFDRISAELGEMKFLAQGTLYPDVVESGVSKGKTAHMIKSHHNVGGLPDDMTFELVEPLRELFKDEVRNVGRALGLPESLIERHPFPGPGLAVRIMGDITKERIQILQEADQVYMDILHEDGLYNEIWQAFAVLIPVKTVGVMGDQRTYESLLGIRAVTSTDGMTADWYRMPADTLSKISNRIVNSVRGINRVVYDITSKPPGTIEWE